jgi:hypothetical protein
VSGLRCYFAPPTRRFAKSWLRMKAGRAQHKLQRALGMADDPN